MTRSKELTLSLPGNIPVTCRFIHLDRQSFVYVSATGDLSFDSLAIAIPNTLQQGDGSPILSELLGPNTETQKILASQLVKKTKRSIIVSYNGPELTPEQRNHVVQIILGELADYQE